MLCPWVLFCDCRLLFLSSAPLHFFVSVLAIPDSSFIAGEPIPCEKSRPLTRKHTRMGSTSKVATALDLTALSEIKKSSHRLFVDMEGRMCVAGGGGWVL